ncbi:hypothetical protein IPM62_05960 [Candidatus Woesebacteria bacterium]|nr:MAG: hypothetical protein IPM62_05960 [Candidatus Woesebacteria bacterium]
MRDSVGWQREWTELHNRDHWAEENNMSTRTLSRIFNETIPNFLLMDDERGNSLLTPIQRKLAGNAGILVRIKVNRSKILELYLGQNVSTPLGQIGSTTTESGHNDSTSRDKMAHTNIKDYKKDDTPKGVPKVPFGGFSTKEEKINYLKALLSIDDKQFLKEMIDEYPEIDTVKEARRAAKWIKEKGAANILSRKRVFEKFLSRRTALLRTQKERYRMHQEAKLLDQYYEIFPSRKPKDIGILIKEVRLFKELLANNYTEYEVIEAARIWSELPHIKKQGGKRFASFIDALPGMVFYVRKNKTLDS